MLKKSHTPHLVQPFFLHFYTSSPIIFLALSSWEMIFTSSQHSSEIFKGWDDVVVIVVDGSPDNDCVTMLGKSICISIDGDGAAAIGDDDRLDDDILLLLLNFDV